MKVLYITPMYPSATSPVSGVMITEMAKIFHEHDVDFRVAHLDGHKLWPFRRMKKYRLIEPPVQVSDPPWVMRYPVHMYPRAFGITVRAGRWGAGLARAISKSWPEFHPDVVHGRTFVHGGLPAAYLAKHWGCPLVISTHGADTHVLIRRWLSRRVMSR